MTRLRPGLCSVTLRALAPDAVVALAVQAGLDGIEWGGDVHVPAGDLARARAVRKLTEDAGLQIVSYGSYVRPPTDGPAEFSAALDTARALGAPNIRVWPGARDKASAAYTAVERAAVTGLVGDFARAAAAHGVTVSLEYHPGTLTDDAASAAALLQAVATLYSYWQPRPGLAQDAALAELARLGKHLSHLHVFAWDRHSVRFPMDHAAGFWTAVLAALPPSRWPGDRFALLEFVAGDRPEALLADARALHRLLGSRPRLSGPRV